jgi:predicted choloylglycine hydrolase
MHLNFTAIDEPLPAEKWTALFQRLWPAYSKFWLSEGEQARPTYLECLNAVSTHMPEFLPVYERLVELAGGSDHAARFLSGYSPPAYFAACSQAVWHGAEPMLVRNYDYSPRAFDAVVLRTRWMGRRVLGVSDCLIGLLDGINEDGLVVSLTFGGRRVVGRGFGVPVILRYILETCSSVDQAVEVLQRIPCHMAYNVTVMDPARRHRTIFLGPDRPAVVTRSAIATNHQHQVEWLDHARATSSVEREELLLKHLKKHPGTARRFISSFQRPPLYSLNFERGFGTLYTAAYRPLKGALELHWPGYSWNLFLDKFEEGVRRIEYQTPHSLGLAQA